MIQHSFWAFGSVIKTIKTLSKNRYNGIKVNPEKSQLIIVNSSEKDEDNYVKYGKNTTIIKPLKKSDSTRFLGV